MRPTNWFLHLAPSASSDEEAVSFVERSLRDSIRARELALSSSPFTPRSNISNALEDTTADTSINPNYSFSTQRSYNLTGQSSVPRFLTRQLTKEVSPKVSRSDNPPLGSSKLLTVEAESEVDDSNQLQDMLNQWSTPEMKTYLGEAHEEDVRTYQMRKKQQEDEEVTRIESKLSSLWSERQNRLQRHLDVIKAEQQRVEELRLQRIREIEEKRRKAEEEEQKRIQLEREKAEAERIRIAELEAEKARQAAEIKRKAEEADAAKKAAEEKAAEVKKAAEEAESAKKAAIEQANKSATAFTNWGEVEKEFLKHKEQIADIKTNILAPVTNNKSLKSVCFQAKRKVKPKLGQLTDSLGQFSKLFQELVEVVEECKNTHELVYLWILNFFSKSVVAQAETETTVSLQSAVPLGRLAVSMIIKFEPLRDLLIARFVKKCPLVIGYSCAVDTEEGRLRMGWKRKGDKWEDPAVYAERLSGISAVWTAMTLSDIDTQGTPHPSPLSDSWRFLARMCNTQLKILDNVHFAVVAIWWDIASDTFSKKYGKQGMKLLRLASGQWTQQVLDKRFPSALRLGLLGEDWQMTRQLKRLKAMEP